MIKFIRFLYTWIVEDLERLANQLKKPDTWILIGMLLVFGVLLVVVVYFLLRFDASLQLRHISMISCREIGDLQGVALVFAGMAFVMTITVALGEFANYTDEKRLNAERGASSARSALILAAVATAVGAGMLFFLNKLCS